MDTSNIVFSIKSTSKVDMPLNTNQPRNKKTSQSSIVILSNSFE